MGSTPATPFLLYVGGLSPHKNLARLIEAFARSGLERDGLTLVLVGDTGDVFHTHVPELRAAVERSGLGGRVVFTGFVPDDDLVYFYNRAKALVQPSLMEGFGLPPVEAMACGTPVLSSTAGSLPEVVGDAGLFFDPTDVGAIASALRAVVDEPRLRAGAGRQGVAEGVAVLLGGLGAGDAGGVRGVRPAGARHRHAAGGPGLEGVRMKFCMLTTFFGSHSFGGDAAFVDRLSRSLADHGHEVHVIHCRDAFEASRGGESPRPYEPHPGVRTHPLASPVSVLSPLATHQTGHPLFKARAIRRLIREIGPDVVHFHNLSLIGGPGLLSIPAPGAVKFMTAHEHWLVCPLSVLWKFDRGVCETRECVKCCVKASRPPQFWRKTSLLDRSLGRLDALICPSRSTIHEHARRGINARMVHLPYFLPADYTGRPPAPTPRARPPVRRGGGTAGEDQGVSGRDRRHAATCRGSTSGSQGRAVSRPELRAQAGGLANVHFEGRLDAPEVAAPLPRGAGGGRAVARV